MSFLEVRAWLYYTIWEQILPFCFMKRARFLPFILKLFSNGSFPLFHVIVVPSYAPMWLVHRRFQIKCKKNLEADPRPWKYYIKNLMHKYFATWKFLDIRWLLFLLTFSDYNSLFQLRKHQSFSVITCVYLNLYVSVSLKHYFPLLIGVIKTVCSTIIHHAFALQCKLSNSIVANKILLTTKYFNITWVFMPGTQPYNYAMCTFE